MSQLRHGILNINKPTGWTSHDVVAKARGILSTRRVGHTGTLDPLATGVLVICVGKATRVAEYLTASDKQYRAGILLGTTTDTYDTDGQVTAQLPVPELSLQDLIHALAGFLGEIQQVPPIYSAIKKDGVPLYKLARRGEVTSPEPRTVCIHNTTLLDWHTPNITLDVTCGPGTYIRSLAYDLGQILGCGAVLTSLTRLRSGSFKLEEAITLEALAEAEKAGNLDQHFHPLQAGLSALTPVRVDGENAKRLSHGIAIPCPTPPENNAGYALDLDGQVVAILAYDSKQSQWRPRKVFVSNN
jgi:tRNA pseudouridine55 synthase